MHYFSVFLRWHLIAYITILLKKFYFNNLKGSMDVPLLKDLHWLQGMNNTEESIAPVWQK